MGGKQDKGHKESFGGNRYDHYGCSDDFIVVSYTDVHTYHSLGKVKREQLCYLNFIETIKKLYLKPLGGRENSSK